MSMHDCKSKSIDQGRPNVRQLVLKSLKYRHPEEGEQDTAVEWRGNGSLQKGREIRIDLNA